MYHYIHTSEEMSENNYTSEPSHSRTDLEVRFCEVLGPRFL